MACETICTFFKRFFRFFQNPKKHDFLCFWVVAHVFPNSALYHAFRQQCCIWAQNRGQSSETYRVPPKNCTTKFLAEHWQKLGQILTVFHHWKRTKFSTKLLQYLYSHLKHVATLPYETQNAKLPQITNKEVAKLWRKLCQFLTDFQIIFTVVKRTFSFQLNNPYWQQTTYITINKLRKLEDLWKT